MHMPLKTPASILAVTLLAAIGTPSAFAQQAPVVAPKSAAAAGAGAGESKAAESKADEPNAVEVEADFCKLDPSTGDPPLSDLPNYFAGAEDLRGGVTCTFRIKADRPPFTFHFEGHPDNSLGNLEIHEGPNSEITQTIDNTTDPGEIYPTPAKNMLIAVDANFDGYNDLQLLSNCGATGNCSYDFYLYDPKVGQFIHNEFLSTLTTPSFDSAKKQVMSTSNGSANDWQSETYQFKDGEYTLVHKEESVWDRDKSVVTVNTYDLRDGKLQLVSSTTNPE
jgi:hypothetical protein